MKPSQRTLLVSTAVFFLLLISYRFSLLHPVSQLPYLMTPEMVMPFQKIVTYTLMLTGLPPTVLLIFYTSTFCTTSYPNNVVQFTCFGSPFAMGDSTGFFAWIVASLIVTYLVFVVLSAMNTQARRRK